MTVYEYLDNCPECNEPSNRPQSTTWRDGGIRITYCCPNCQHSWFTSWEPQNGESAESTSTFREAS